MLVVGRGVSKAQVMRFSHLGLPVEHVEPPPAFLHAGFRALAPPEVRTLMARMEADGVTIVERNDEARYTAFKCLDPDGHRIEVYWEPPFA